MLGMKKEVHYFARSSHLVGALCFLLSLLLPLPTAFCILLPPFLQHYRSPRRSLRFPRPVSTTMHTTTMHTIIFGGRPWIGEPAGPGPPRASSGASHITIDFCETHIFGIARGGESISVFSRSNGARGEGERREGCACVSQQRRQWRRRTSNETRDSVDEMKGFMRVRSKRWGFFPL